MELKAGVGPEDVEIFDDNLGNFTTDSLQIEGNYLFVKVSELNSSVFDFQGQTMALFCCAIMSSKVMPSQKGFF